MDNFTLFLQLPKLLREKIVCTDLAPFDEEDRRNFRSIITQQGKIAQPSPEVNWVWCGQINKGVPVFNNKSVRRMLYEVFREKLDDKDRLVARKDLYPTRKSILYFKWDVNPYHFEVSRERKNTTITTDKIEVRKDLEGA